jgi:predicted ATPase/class 3 adenylate cyclase
MECIEGSIDLQLPSGTVTFLTTDIVGFSALFEKDADLARDLTMRQAELICRTVTDQGGAVFKIVGDAVWAAFPTAPQAVSCALNISSALRDSAILGKLRLRMALLTGEATPIGGDYLERALNRCSRLCSKCKPGKILVGGSTYELTRSDFEYRPVGRLELRGVPDETAWELQTGPEGPKSVDPERSLGIRPRALPEEDRPFIGRSRERSDLNELLSDPKVRLLTITGMGGIGKTRLCMEVARDASSLFPDGVCHVPCDAIRGSSELFAAIVAALDLELEDSSMEALASEIGDARLLLLLDCFERLVDERQVVDELLRQTRSLKILATSRTLIDLPREYEYVLGPMSGSGSGGRFADAVALFWDAAEHADLRFRSSRSRARTAIQIVEALEGVPLAILLAATSLSHMTLEELLAQIRSRRFATLKRAPVGGQDRHANLIRVIGDSFDLLGRAEMQLMVDLSCFKGFFMEDALAVLGDLDDVRDGISQLRKHSLIAVQRLGARMRFRMLDTVREYVERQHSDWVRPEVEFAHSVHYTRRAVEMGEQIASGDWKGAHSLLWLEMGNFRQAIRLAAERADSGLLEDQARSLARPMAEAGLSSEFDLLAGAVRSNSNEMALDAQAVIEGQMGMVARRSGRNEEATTHWTRCAELWDLFGDPDRSADVLTDLIDTALTDGDLPAADRSLERFKEIGRRHELGPSVRSSGLVLEARIACVNGNAERARELSTEALELCDRSPVDHNAIYVICAVGEIAFALGELVRSEALLHRALRLAADGNYPGSARRLLLDLADLHRTTSDPRAEAMCLATAKRVQSSMSAQVRIRLTERVAEAHRRLGSEVLEEAEAGLDRSTWAEASLRLVSVGRSAQTPSGPGLY